MTEAPISIDLARGEVELLDLGSATLDEPFFRDSVDRAMREGPDRLPRRVDLPGFVLNAGAYPVAPDAIVFHAGRCGSTLLINMLVRGGDFVAVKEPEILSELVSAWLTARGGRRRQVELIAGASLRILLGAIEGPRRRILKPAAWNIQMANALLAMFGSAACAFIFRAPEETVASQLHQPPAWFAIIDAPRSAQARFFPSLGEIPEGRRLSLTLLFAHAWRSAVEAACAVPGRRLVFLDYDELIVEPATTLRRLLETWGWPASDDRLSEMVGALSTYSKDPGSRAPFDPSGVHRRPPLSPSQRREVEAVTGEAWQKLQRACART